MKNVFVFFPPSILSQSSKEKGQEDLKSGINALYRLSINILSMFILHMIIIRFLTLIRSPFLFVF